MSRSTRDDDDDDDNDELANQGPRYGFSPKQIQEYKIVFKEFDTNGASERARRRSAIGG